MDIILCQCENYYVGGYFGALKLGSLDNFMGLNFCNFTKTLDAYEFDNFSWIRRPQNPQKFEPHKN